MSLDKAIAMAVKTGKVAFGAKTAIRSAKLRKAKLIVLAQNCPEDIKRDIEYYCRLSKIPVIIYEGSSIDLGLTCGKPFMVSALTIRDPGRSNILKVVKEHG
ncbi:50S ribosomal protein L30e [Candidatus Bathyarchaeota archaeon]|nr:MAG: 50S ribosomal protein L30e [Candidatus Bathyarchaeota archaeon]